MFSGTSKWRLIGWVLFWSVLFLTCWSVDTLMTRFLAVIFLTVASVLATAAYKKFQRDARYRELNQQYTPIEPLDPAPSSRRFGPPSALN